MAEQAANTPEVISWDWKAQPDLPKLAAAVRRLSGGRCDMREVDTGGDFYAVVVADQRMTQEQAQDLFEQVYCADA